MAFTPEQEAKLLQIISAYDAGETIGDLTDAVGTADDMDFEVEVDGVTGKTNLGTHLQPLENDIANKINKDGSNSAVVSLTCVGKNDDGIDVNLVIAYNVTDGTFDVPLPSGVTGKVFQHIFVHGKYTETFCQYIRPVFCGRLLNLFCNIWEDQFLLIR